ncbi:MAG: F0F1 ATP synthase subunit epsilon [Weeksellaceae bacterium]|nr:F0F1 ATP synthase subunit epsilon [Weeksellaceae bacterium]
MGIEVQIITPEEVIFHGEVDSVIVPGSNGSFQMLQNHAPIVSTLQQGTIKILTHTVSKIDFKNETGKLELSPADSKVYHLEVNGGIVEFSNNKLTVLAE